jgi:hypothetical protein
MSTDINYNTTNNTMETNNEDPYNDVFIEGCYTTESREEWLMEMKNCPNYRRYRYCSWRSHSTSDPCDIDLYHIDWL